MIVALVSVALLIVKAALLSVMFVSVRVNDRSWIHALFLGKSERTRPNDTTSWVSVNEMKDRYQAKFKIETVLSSDRQVQADRFF